jgi:hypothetical protein
VTTCRTCYAHSLPDEQRLRFLEEPITMPVFYCPEHQAAVDRLHSLVDWSKVENRGTVTGRLSPERARGLAQQARIAQSRRAP